MNEHVANTLLTFGVIVGAVGFMMVLSEKTARRDREAARLGRCRRCWAILRADEASTCDECFFGQPF